MQGIFINGSRPKTKKQVKEQLSRINNHLQDPDTYPQGHPEADDPYSVVIEATSMFSNEFDGSLAKALDCRDPECPNRIKQEPSNTPDDQVGPQQHSHLGPFYIVGPDPYTSRKWYAKLEFNPNNNEWRLS